MAQVPMRLANPGLVPPHQQRPPMMVSMTQPPPVSMQGLVSMAPMMGGGMINPVDSGHEHHNMNGHYHHPTAHHAPPHHPRPQTHHVPPPPLHQSGPPSQPPPPHSQYHPHANVQTHPQHHGHSAPPHNVHHSNTIPGQHMNTHNNTNGMQIQNAHMNQQAHSITHHSAPHQMNTGNISTQPHHHVHHTSQQQQQPQMNPHQMQQHAMTPSQPVQTANVSQVNHAVPQHTNRHVISQQQHNHVSSGQTHVIDNNNSSPTNNGGIVPHSGPGIIVLSNPNQQKNIQQQQVSVNGNNNCANNNSQNSSSTNSPQVISGNVLPPNGIPLSNNPDLDPLSTREKTPMCLINELARYNKIQHQYCLTDEKGPAHKKIFTVTLRLGENEEEYSSSGASIKKAQHSAAGLALEKTKFKHPPPKTQRQNKQTKLTPTVELNALAMKRGEAALYTFMETSRAPNPYNAYNMPPNIRAVYSQQKYYPARPAVYPMFFVTLKVGSREFTGEGATAQQAKHNAASKALKIIKALPMPDTASSNVVASQPGADLSELDPNADLKSPISLVHEVALKRNLTVGFEVVRESGPPHMRTFVTTCIVGEIRSQGEGTGKKISKKRAAELMLDELKKLPPAPSAVLTRVKRKNTTKKKSRNLIKVGQEEQKATPDYGQGINPISRLIQIQQAKKEKEPVYTLLAERGVPRRREFVMQVEVGVNNAQGTGPNKKLAKRAAAESMLQLLGYSRPQPQPGKPTIKMDGNHVEAEKSRKQVTFMEENESARVVEAPTATNPNAMTSSLAGGSGRQLVPGLIMMPDHQGFHSIQQQQQAGTMQMGMANIQATAAIAKELLETGNSATAIALSQKQGSTSTTNQQPVVSTAVSSIAQPPVRMNQQSNVMPVQNGSMAINHQPQPTMIQNRQPTPPPPAPNNQQPPIIMQNSAPPPTQIQQTAAPIVVANRNNMTITNTTPTVQAVRPKDQLMYLANILNLQVQFTDFPKGNKSEFLSLVSLSTMPPHVSHGAGSTIDASHDQACLTALKALAELGLDTVTSNNTAGTTN